MVPFSPQKEIKQSLSLHTLTTSFHDFTSNEHTVSKKAEESVEEAAAVLKRNGNATTTAAQEQSSNRSATPAGDTPDMHATSQKLFSFAGGARVNDFFKNINCMFPR